jgi:hypothetical protein
MIIERSQASGREQPPLDAVVCAEDKQVNSSEDAATSKSSAPT